MELIPHGHLGAQGTVGIKDMQVVLRQALNALAYLHGRNITHRDIKPENILVQSRIPDFIIKLCDFGLSTEQSNLETFCGTKYYLAPEACKRSYTNAVDIWALGLVGLQFIIGLPEFPRDDQRKWYSMIHDTLCKHRDDSRLPLLKKMLEYKPKHRHSAKLCLSHTWLTEPLSMTSTEKRATAHIVSEEPTLLLSPAVNHRAQKRLRSS